MKKFLLVLILILVPTFALAADYYCDFEGANGDGTQGSPFNSIANAMASMSASDNLYCRGTTTSEQNCSKGVYIYGNDSTWLAYGGGNNQATINASSNDGIKFTTDADNAKIDGFIISTSARYGILSEATAVEMSNNTITDVGDCWIYLNPEHGDNRNTLIHDNSCDTSGVVHVENGYGITMFNEGGGKDANGTKIYNNSLKNAGESALRLTCSDIHIYGNYIYKWGQPNGDDNAAQIGAGDGETCDNFYFYNNIIHGGGVGDGNGLQFYVLGSGSFGEIYIQNNAFADIKGTASDKGWAISGLARYGTTKTVVKNNIFYNCGSYVGSDPSQTTDLTTLKIHNSGLANLFLEDNIIMNDSYSETIRIMNETSGDADQHFTIAEAETEIGDAGGTASNNVAVVPGWVDVTPGDDPDSFKLTSSTANGGVAGSYPGDNCYSATRQEGTNEYTYPDDYEGTTRQTSGGWDMGAFFSSPGISAALTGTIVAGGVTEAEIVAGGETLIVTLTNDTFVATFGDNNQITTDFIAGLDSGGAEAAGWDAEVKGNLVFGDVARTNNTTATITFQAEAAYAITQNETITLTIPASSLTSSAAAIVATPTFEITATSDPAAALTGTLADNATEAQIVAGGETLIITLTNDTWVAAGATFDGIRQDIIDGMDSAQSEGTGWNAEVRDKEVVGAVVRTNDTVVTITLTAAAAYDISANESITMTVPASALVTSGDPVVATPDFAIIFFDTSTEKIVGMTLHQGEKNG